MYLDTLHTCAMNKKHQKYTFYLYIVVLLYLIINKFIFVHKPAEIKWVNKCKKKIVKQKDGKHHKTE